jgi:hypothetical protein
MAKHEEESVRRIEELVRQLEELSDPKARQVAHSLMEAVLELHGSGIERMMDMVYETGDPGKAAIRRFAGDSLVSSLLLLHGLHPDDIETRVRHALWKLHGAADLLGVFDGVVRVRLTRTGCGLKDSVGAELRDAVPDACEIVIEDALPSDSFVPLTSLAVPVGTGAL